MFDMILDWIWLYIQIALLGIIIIRELLYHRNRNLYAILISFTMLVLVQGQAWWMLNQFQSGEGDIVHLYQSVSLEATRLANLYAGLCVISLVISYVFMARHKFKQPLPSDLYDQVLISTQQTNSPFSYILIAGWVIIFGAILILLLGGLQAAIDNPGTSVGGQTMLLIFVSLGKMPLLHKISVKQRVNIYDILIFAITFFLTLINSRFLATFMLVQVLLLFNYCYKQIPRRWILGGSLILIFIFIVYGLYRDNGATNTGLNWHEKLDDLFNRFNQDESPVDWFYRTNVEGFVGLAGILTYDSQVGGIDHDFGLSNLTLFTQLIPNVIRNDQYLVAPVADFLESLYPYPEGSVVPPGLEIAYAHFGVPGIILMGFLLGYLADFLHRKMLDHRQDRLRLALLSVQSMNIVRNMLRNILFFGLADWTMLFAYRVILNFGKKQDKRADSKSY
ncbi:MAG: O-antigen polymerase [Gloeotrichia echinulata HAB0833]